MNKIKLIGAGKYVHATVDGSIYDNITITHGFNEISVKRDNRVLMTTDSEKSIEFGESLGSCEIETNRKDVFKTRLVKSDGVVVFDIESLVAVSFLSHIVEDTLVNDYTNDTSFVVRYNPFRFFLPLKMEVVDYSKGADIDNMVFICSYLWLKKNMTSHDILN